MDEMTLFDLLPDEEAARFKPIKSDDWKWSFADYPKEKNGLKVFSCFACGGGSTMGYKLAGCDVIGCCEIDPRMNEVYVKNHNPPKSKVYVNLLEHMLPTDKYMGDITLRVRGVKSGYNTAIVQDDDVCQTLIAGGGAFYRGCDKLHMTDWDTGRAATFPTDYDYCGQPARYVCGMSVPPVMMKRIIMRLIDEGVFDYKLKGRRETR